MSAEIYPQKIKARRILKIASMGPRSDERGNEKLAKTLKMANLGMLQWGRAPMSAEMWAQKNYHAPGKKGASMGPRSDERGNCSTSRLVVGAAF